MKTLRDLIGVMLFGAGSLLLIAGMRVLPSESAKKIVTGAFTETVAEMSEETRARIGRVIEGAKAT